MCSAISYNSCCLLQALTSTNSSIYLIGLDQRGLRIFCTHCYCIALLLRFGDGWRLRGYDTVLDLSSIDLPRLVLRYSHTYGHTRFTVPDATV